MRVWSCLAITFWLGTLACADHIPTNATWRGITVSTSEEFWALGRSKEKKYPIHWMFDGKPETAWVYESKREMPKGAPIHFPGKVSVCISMPEDFTVDGLRLMNGYNKSVDLYRGNARITGIEVSVRDWDAGGYMVLKRTTLKDEMGWRTVSLPQTKTREIYITVTATKTGPLKDICISELQLLNRGKAIDLKPTEIIVAQNGDECGCGGSTWFYDRGYGFRREIKSEFVESFASPNGQRVAALYDILVGRQWAGTMTVFDGRAGRELKVKLPSGFVPSRLVRWIGNDTLQVKGHRKGQDAVATVRF